MGDWSWFSWTVSLGLTAWVLFDAKRRKDGRVALWGILAFFFPWVFGPVYWFFLRGRGAGDQKGAALPPAKRKDAVTRTAPHDVDAAVAAMAAEIAGAPTPAASADILRQVGRQWADAISKEAKAGGVATLRVLVESAAEATARGDYAKAQEQVDKALSHVRGGARRHPGGRIILAGLAQLAREAPAEPRPAAMSDREPTPIVRPAVNDREPTPVARSAEPARRRHALETEPDVPKGPRPADATQSADSVPAFISSRQPSPTPGPAPASVKASVAEAKPAAAAPSEPPARRVVTAPPIAPLAPDLAQRFRDEPLDEFSARVTALSARWLAEVVERAPSTQRSYARVKLESAASAVYRGDFRRAIAMADEAAELVPADVESADTLRAGLRCALEARNA